MTPPRPLTPRVAAPRGAPAARQREDAHQRGTGVHGRPAPERLSRPRRTPTAPLAAGLLALAVGYWWALLAVLALPAAVVIAADAALPAAVAVVRGAGRRCRRGWRA